MDIDCGVDFPIDAHAAMGISRGLERRIREDAMRHTFGGQLAGLLKLDKRATW
jgi:hypothetical protein